MTPEQFRKNYGPAALVTGASSGIGWAFAQELAARGFELALTARRTDRLENIARQIAEEHGIKPQIIAADLADPDAPAALLDATCNLDIGLVVSNAGFGLKGPHEANDPSAMADMVTVNCHAPMQLAHGFIPRLKQRGSGAIAFTSSIEGLMGCPFSTSYSATKALVIALGEGLWGELSGSGIDVLTICPGATESEAAAKQGIDIAQLDNVMPARDVARASLDNLDQGPTFFPSQHYKAQFDGLLALPRRDALKAMAGAMGV